MKKTLTLVLLLTASIFSSAQYPLEAGRLEINLGTGYTNQGLPLYVGLDLGVAENFSLGVDGTYRYFNNNTGNTMFKHNFIDVLGNVSYHLNSLFRVRSNVNPDLYIGLCGGYTMVNSPVGYAGEIESGAAFGGRLGYRMYFSEKIGLDLELDGMNHFFGARVGLTILL